MKACIQQIVFHGSQRIFYNIRINDVFARIDRVCSLQTTHLRLFSPFCCHLMLQVLRILLAPRCLPTQLLRHLSLFKTRKGLQAKRTKGQPTRFSVLSYIKSYYLCVQGYELFRVLWSCPVDCHSDLRHRCSACHGNRIFVAPAVGLDSIDSLAAVGYFAVCLGILLLFHVEALPLNIDPANISGA